MSTQNEINDQGSFHTKLLVTDNKFVYCLNPACSFLKVSFKNKICKKNLGTVDIEDCPVGLVTILGSTKNQMQACIEHTDWLIDFLEKTEEPIRETGKNLDNSDNSNAPMNTSPGIFIWPTKYLISRNDSSKMVVLVMYVQGENCEELENFAAVACSNIFVFNNQKKEVLHQRTNKLLAKVNKQPAIISVCSDNHLLQFDCITELVPIKRTTGTDLLFQDIGLFLQNVEDKVNAASRAPKQDLESESKEFSKSSLRGVETNTASLKQVSSDSTGSLAKEEKFTHNRLNADVEKHHQVSSLGYAAASTKQNEEPDNSNSKTTVTTAKETCQELLCDTFLETLQRLLQNWISESLNPKNIPSLLGFFQQHFKDDKHCITAEIRELVEVVTLHNFQLCNIFDNYVCFDGDVDSKQFHQLAKAIYCRSSGMLASKNHEYSTLTNTILNTASVSLHIHYVNINHAIIISEQALSLKVNNKLVNMYQIVMRDLLSQQLRHASIQSTHILVRDRVIAVAEKCMNMGDRLNELAKINFTKLRESLDLMFRNLVKAKLSDCKNEFKFLSLEFYIEDYLERFYAGITSTLHEQSAAELVRRHYNVMQNLSCNVQDEHKQNMLLKFHMHLAYIIEVSNHVLIYRNVETTSLTKPFCLYLTSMWYAVHFKSNQGNVYISYEGKPTAPAFLALSNAEETLFNRDAQYVTEEYAKNIKTCDQILNYVTNPNNGHKYNRFLIERFFQKILFDVETVLCHKTNNVVLIIPSSLNIEDRIRIRNIAKAAGLEHVFLADEISLLAYSLICLKSCKTNSAVEVLLSIEVSNEGIRVKIFEEKFKNRIQLSAISLQLWQVGTKRSNNSWFSFMKNRTITNPFSHDAPQSDCSATLRDAIRIAFSHLDSSVPEKSLKYCIVSKLSRYHNLFDEVFKERPEWSEIQNFEMDHAIKAALHFSDIPHRLVMDLSDHGINTPFFEHLEETTLKNYMKLESTSQNLTLPKDPNILEIKTQLLKKCSEMNLQLSSGKIKVRRLIGKLITESIERAENIANDVYTTKEMIIAEDQGLNELIEEHKFCIAIK